MVALHEGATLQGGKYKIERVLGQGGFGITYLAIQSGLEREVAVKEFFMKELCERDESTSHVTLGTEGSRETVNRFREKFLKEARNIARLNHPNIVRIIDVFEENGTAYYVMEHIEGESLSDMVKRRGLLPEEEAVSYIRCVGDALSYIHGRNMNHLDIKPGNIMQRKEDGQIFIIDFGVAKQYDAITSEGTTTTPVGISHGYSPAEQYRKNGVQTFSPQSDVYSLAATLFKLLTGNTPPEAMEILDEGLPVAELQARNVSAHVIAAIQQAMKGRNERTQSITDFLANLAGGSHAEDAEATVILEDVQQRQEAERKAKEEAERKRRDAEAEATLAKQRAELEAKRKELELREKEVQEGFGKKKSKTGKILLCVIGSIAVIAGVILVLRSQHVQEDEANAAQVEPIYVEDTPTYVEDATIVLTKGHESKRNFVYTGEVDAEGLPHGEGTAKYPKTKSCSSCTFTGTFEHGITSQGEMTFSSGTKFVGSFTLDGFFHEGTWTEKDGYYFKGTFGNGEPYNGTWYTPQGKEDGKVVCGE